VDFQNAVQMAREINHQRFINGLPRQTAARRTRQNRHFIFRRQFNRRVNIFVRFRNQHPMRHHLIHAGIGAVEHPAVRIGAYIPTHATLQFAHKSFNHRIAYHHNLRSSTPRFNTTRRGGTNLLYLFFFSGSGTRNAKISAAPSPAPASAAFAACSITSPAIQPMSRGALVMPRSPISRHMPRNSPRELAGARSDPIVLIVPLPSPLPKPTSADANSKPV